MDENTNLTEQIADQQDAFLDGWDEADADAEAEEAADQPTEAEQTEDVPEEQSEASADEKAAVEDAAVEQKQSEAQKATEAPSWIVKHMGEERKISSEEITPELLQKGLDYDRVRGKYDEAKPVIEMFTEFAKSAGMNVADYARYIRAEAKKAGGMSEAEAKRAVELEDREAAVAAAEAAKTESAQKKAAEDARIKADITDFKAAFPDIYTKAKDDPKAIPQTVWDAVVKGGMSLTAAYARYAVTQANELATAASAAAKTAENNGRNAARSTGSMKSAGSDAKNRDPFAAAFDEG